MNLKTAGWILIAGFVLHNGDHARRGIDTVRESVMWGGFFALMVASIVLTLVFTDHPLAAPASTAMGFSLAFGVSAVHLLPDWGPLSDSLPSGNVDALTWVAVLAEIVGAAIVGWVGFQQFRRNNYQLQPEPAPNF